MASLITRRPLLTSATAVTVLATGYYLSSRRPLMMDSAQTPLAHTLSLPKNMLFSKQLKVKDVQQVNHDTKRIIFELPGGKNEVSGVTPGGMQKSHQMRPQPKTNINFIQPRS
jgi:cytochrome-b5 reductase